MDAPVAVTRPSGAVKVGPVRWLMLCSDIVELDTAFT
jgi:hypothetical protein